MIPMSTPSPTTSRWDQTRRSASPPTRWPAWVSTLGDHLRLVRDEAPAAPPPHRSVRGLGVSRVAPEDVLTWEDFEAAHEANVRTAEIKYGPWGWRRDCPPCSPNREEPSSAERSDGGGSPRWNVLLMSAGAVPGMLE